MKIRYTICVCACVRERLNIFGEKMNEGKGMGKKREVQKVERSVSCQGSYSHVTTALLGHLAKTSFIARTVLPPPPICVKKWFLLLVYVCVRAYKLALGSAALCCPPYLETPFSLLPPSLVDS